MNDYYQLTKPRITWLILMSTAIGFFFGVRHFNTTTGQAFQWLVLLHTIVGTGLIASGTAALNQWWEREADAKMRRTQMRPIPSGKITPRNALLFGMTLAIAGFVELWLGANLLTALLGLFTLASYLFLYTPMKQRTHHATTVGAIPGAMPPLIGYAAAAGTLNYEAWALYLILFLWQFPHFYAIAWMYREDYARAGMRMLPVVAPDGESTSRQILLYALALVPISLLPKLVAMAGNVYAIGALLLGGAFLWAAWKVGQNRTIPQARRVLLTSVIYLPLLYGLLVVG